MENQKTQQRIKAIYQMLFEMATGNLAFRIIKTDQDDEVGKISEMLNKLAGEMHDILLRSGYVNPHYQNLEQTTFI
jgi:methyl-accepting chemotaxis protein